MVVAPVRDVNYRVLERNDIVFFLLYFFLFCFVLLFLTRLLTGHYLTWEHPSYSSASHSVVEDENLISFQNFQRSETRYNFRCIASASNS